MPYKDKKDKNANSKRNYNKSKGLRVCEIPSCSNPLPTNKKKFCSEECVKKSKPEAQRLARLKKRLASQKKRVCMHKKCIIVIDKMEHSAVKYCSEGCRTDANNIKSKKQHEAKKALTQEKNRLKRLEFARVARELAKVDADKIKEKKNKRNPNHKLYRKSNKFSGKWLEKLWDEKMIIQHKEIV